MKLAQGSTITRRYRSITNSLKNVEDTQMGGMIFMTRRSKRL
jgi:hypothetical protein